MPLNYFNFILDIVTLEKSFSSLSTKTDTQGTETTGVSPSDYEPEKNSSSDSSPPKKRIRGTKDICTSKVVAILDKSRISSRNAVLLVSSIIEAAGLNVNDYKLSKSSIHEKRQAIRKKKFNEIKEEFNSQDLTNVIVHWDGKLLCDITGNKKVDRLPIVLSYNGTTKLLSVPKLTSGTGRNQADAIFEALQEWGVTNTIVGLCCDTTPSNLGPRNGAATLLEHLLEKNMLYFPCRHHIMEIILRAAFESVIPGTVGPSVTIFDRFEQEWDNLDKKNYKSGLLDDIVLNVLQDDLNEIESDIKKNLKLNLERDDYKELLCLALLFIGVSPQENYTIKKPGARHHARWMSKAIYSLKIFLFRDSFYLSAKNISALQQICIFIVKIYIKYWFVAERPEKAPNKDLNLMRDCHNFLSVNKLISNAVMKKILRHLWYLNPQNAALAFFDNDISVTERRKMVAKLDVSENNDDDEEGEEMKQVLIHNSEVSEVCEQGIDQFISSDTLKFFEKLNLNTEWIKRDPEEWEKDDQYNKSKEIVTAIKVVNDVAERNVHLFAEYNGHLTKNEEQMQYIIHIIESYRQKFPSVNRNYLSKPF